MQKSFALTITFSLTMVLLLASIAACQSTPTNAPTEEPATQEAPAQSEPTEALPEATEEPAPEQDQEPSAPTGGATVFLISGDSEARFYIDEVLRGEDVTVVGVTDQVSGQIEVDLSDLSSILVGEMRVAAGTLVTDSGNRNRAINNFILQTDEYPDIVFTPREVIGL